MSRRRKSTPAKSGADGAEKHPDAALVDKGRRSARTAGTATKTGAATGSGKKSADKKPPMARRRKVVLLALLGLVVALAAAVAFLEIRRASTETAVVNDSRVLDGTADGDATVDGAGTDDGDGNDGGEIAGGAGGDEEPEQDVRQPPVVSVDHGPTEGQFDGTMFTTTFDGDPTAPQPFNPPDWDVTVHSRDPDRWESLDAMDAGHGADCSPPPDTHVLTAYEESVYICKNHMMTAIRGEAYGAIYLTPPYQVDFSEGTAVIAVDVSTFRTSARDWWDIWITPYGESLQLPLDLDAEADFSGPPRNAIRVGLATENQMRAEIYEDFEKVQFPDWPHGNVTGDPFTGYQTFLDPDIKRRDTFEIHLSQTSMKVGMPQYDFWWIDTEIPALDWSSGVVQFGHHSYNPTKDCNVANFPIPPVEECVANTWHWDNVLISPATPFSIVRAEQRTAYAEAPWMTFEPAPADAKLRFAGIGVDMMVRFDDGDWQTATVQATKEETVEEHFASYWVDVPAGTTQVEFQAERWYGGEWHVRDASFWSLGS